MNNTFLMIRDIDGNVDIVNLAHIVAIVPVHEDSYEITFVNDSILVVGKETYDLIMKEIIASGAKIRPCLNEKPEK